MESITNLFAIEWEKLLTFLPKLAGALIVLLLFVFIGKSLAGAFSSVLRKLSSNRIHEAFFRTLIQLVVVYFGLVIALNIVGLEKLALSILAGGGVTAIVLGFAFREIGENFLAGIFLAFSRPFEISDLINTEGIEGRVQAIELRYTHLRSDDGQDIFVPSSQLFTKPVINFTRDGLRRINFTVGIDYNNDAKLACALLKNSVQSIEGVLEIPPASVTINSLEPQYVEIKIYYWQNIFDDSVDGRTLRINVIDSCRRVLIENDFIVSADTTSNIAVSGKVGRD
ncbi:MAG: mechanosensitive ion channel [Gammaproteobacteria bacterium]|jgi:small-conductance mechanosensitive channel|nr:mechanosensitive ion channel [Gammaproteobacteria bacterium]MBT6044309.1 mechanosensitive ion channel [Gammaproteobacteria bacterium]